MDFKVAGTRNVITALQLDMKIEGLPADVLRKALNQAMDARHHILDIMEDTITEPAESLSGNAPRLETIELPKDKIGEVIGCLLYTSPSPRDLSTSRMPSSA